MGTREKIQAARTIATSLDRHSESILKRADGLQSRIGEIEMAIGGTRSGLEAVKHVDQVAAALKTAATELLQVKADMQTYATTLENS